MKNFIPTGKRTITPINAARLLDKHGTEVSPERAKLILDFLYKFAKLSAAQVINADFNKKTPEKKTPRNLFR
ncbi:hypothetical protein SAMN04487898_11550 [Pedobacter sp. ok626]|uniref:hypothetical protein n=1 Tax=Pedobacter sp. ok626 TaxID=1761882 RepID=UPI0008813B18|nr:hypothetical protein [Pedobacter sp. ok626]SDL11846.1 hypothetical protein SAMN04487898_11550 [Pedobacter sp. ok626]